MNRFNKIAQIWDANPRRLFMAEEIFNAIRAKIDLQPNMKVADIGTGTGLLLIQFLPYVEKIFGYDNAPEMLKVLAEKTQKAQVFNVETVLFNADNDSFLEKEFDLFVSSMAFHHIQDVENLFVKIYKATKQGRKIAIADLEKEDGTFHSEIDDSIKHFGFEKEHFFAFIENAGFKNIQVETIFSTQREGKSFPIFLATAEK